MRWLIISGLFAMALPARAAWSQDAQGRISGTVTATEGGAPLEGATVTISGSRLGAVSGADGRYTIGGVAPGTYRVRATRIGYAPSSLDNVTVAAGATAAANFRLSSQAMALNRVVVVGYGTQTRANVTGAVASIAGSDVSAPTVPTPTLSGALEGRAPGVQVISAGGLPGGGVSVRIRGTNSITANSEPLYVVDGIPALQGTVLSDPTQNPLVTIDPNDIESIDILKDASATSIYGARGANGVVLITTKRGERGADRLSLESSVGTQSITKQISVLNAQQYRTLRNEALANGLQPAAFTAAQIASAPTYDYQDMILRRAAQQNHTLTFSGGDPKTRYLLSGNYMNQDGIVYGTQFRRYSARANLDRELNDRLGVGTSLSLGNVTSNLSQVENGQLAGNSRGVLAAMVYDPALPVRDANGNYIQRAVLGEFVANPVATTHELIDQRNENRFLGSGFARYDLTEGLQFRTSVSTNIWNAYNPGYMPSYIYQGAGVHGQAQLWQGRSTDFVNENLLTYRRDHAGPGSLDLTGGTTIQKNNYDWNQIIATNFQVEQPQWNAIGTGSDRPQLTNGNSQWTLLSYLGRANYNLADRYLLTLSGRYDGSSRFGANNKWAFFPSAAVAWRLSQEGFMRNQHLFDDLKLRLSYGRTGNQAVDPYMSLAQLAATYTGVGGTDQVGYAPADVAPNPDLRWETTDQLNAGVDMTFLQSRVTVTADAYTSRTNDLLLRVNMPFTSGFATQLRNIGSIKNKGVELGITTVNVTGDRFSWRSTFNIAHNRNEVAALGGGLEYIETGADRWGWALGGNSHIIKPGEPLGTFYGYKVLGLWQQGQPCDLKPGQERPTLDCVPGELHIADVNGDGKISADDRTIIGHADPTFYGGLTNDFTVGPFSLGAFVSFSKGNQVLNGSNAFLMNSTGALNERADVLNRWTPTNTNTDIPRANSNRKTLVYSTLIEDGSFIRLQTLSLGYQLPPRLVPWAQSAKLYLTGQNLFTATHYSGFDPEVNSLNGSPAARGVDVGAYPRARVWNIGTTLTF